MGIWYMQRPARNSSQTDILPKAKSQAKASARKEGSGMPKELLETQFLEVLTPEARKLLMLLDVSCYGPLPRAARGVVFWLLLRDRPVAPARRCFATRCCSSSCCGARAAAPCLAAAQRAAAPRAAAALTVSAAPPCCSSSCCCAARCCCCASSCRNASRCCALVSVASRFSYAFLATRAAASFLAVVVAVSEYKPTISSGFSA
jgi:hypothetical protein